MSFDYMIWDMQFGSTGKGLLAGYLAHRMYPDAIMSAWAPNAGHTFIDNRGIKTVRTMLPIGTVSDPRYVMLGPGSVINIDSLLIELAEARIRGWKGELVIHGTAAIVYPDHRESERKHNNIGSTQKGSSEAVIEKMRRSVDSPNIARAAHNAGRFEDKARIVETPEWLALVSRSRCIQIEAAQGHSLSIDHGFYPYTTSRDTSPLRVLADCGWPLSRGIPQVYGTARTYPIRVANRFDDKGDMVGWSGPGYSDQLELEWTDIGQKAELTTVTKLPRRVFTFSEHQIQEAAKIGRPQAVFLNFVNYIEQSGYHPGKLDLPTLINKVQMASNAPVKWLGRGPTEDDVMDCTV